MLIKIYEVRGMMEWHPVFTVGRTRLQVSFTGGHLCDGAVNAATFTTSDSVVQKVIERSEAFRSGRIRLRRQFGSPVADPVAGSAAETGGQGHSLPEKEFGSLGLASDFLQYEKKVPVDRLVDEESCREEARKHGFTIKLTKEEM